MSILRVNNRVSSIRREVDDRSLIRTVCGWMQAEIKVLQEGHGDKRPKTNEIVYVHYTGRLIDGTVFDTTEGESLPALFVVRDLIVGWQIVLTRMHEGDRWEVFIPAKWAYGSSKMGDIPAYSSLIFEIELVKIER